MKRSLSDEATGEAMAPLRKANAAFAERYPGETGRRQPVHTVYGGAHLFKAESAERLGTLALRSLKQYAPDFLTFARAINLPGADRLPRSEDSSSELSARLEAEPEMVRRSNKPAWLAHTIYARVLDKLKREAVEDFRIDFEDGYGNRPDAEEDGHAAAVGAALADGLARRTLPPFIGLRVKPLTEELRARSVRTLDIVLSALIDRGGTIPE